MVEARSYPRENTEEMGAPYMQLVNIFANHRKRVPTPVKSSSTVPLRLVTLDSATNDSFCRAKKNRSKKKVILTCSETSKNEVFLRFLAPRRGKFLRILAIS